jgi:hypothetical protein
MIVAFRRRGGWNAVGERYSGVGVNAPQRQVCAAKALEPDAGGDDAEKGRWQESCDIVG